MDTWDQNKLESVIQEKHGEKVSKQTEIVSTYFYFAIIMVSHVRVKVCKHFLDAIEKNLYGWFWVCPNDGKNCK